MKYVAVSDSCCDVVLALGAGLLNYNYLIESANTTKYSNQFSTPCLPLSIQKLISEQMFV